MEKVYIGIDPGTSGAIAILNEDGSVRDCFDMPLEMGKAKKSKATGKLLKAKPISPARVDADALISKLSGLSGKCVIERVHSMPGDGKGGAFSFGESAGVVRGIAAAMGFEVELKVPTVWKKHFGLLKTDKYVSSMLAQELYPGVKIMSGRIGPKSGVEGYNDGKADALLIARFGIEHDGKKR